MRVTDLSKRFGEVAANEQVSLEVWPGEVHCLLGENGAGKSTLIAMLAGLQQPDQGQIELAGRRTVCASPADSIAHGIGVVFQHSALIATMTVAENLMLSGDGSFWLNREAALDHLASVGELFDVKIDPRARVGDLSLGERQQLEIAKVLLGDPSVLVLDEPTSMLSASAIEKLGTSIRRLTARGVAVILVTHKLDEALQMSDRITVLRGGRVAARFETAELRQQADSSESILKAMFGGESVKAAPPRKADARELGPEMLRLEQLSVPGQPVGLHELDLQVRAGEVLGVAGVDGQGQRALAEVIAGQVRASSGRVVFAGADIGSRTVRQRQSLGIRYVTDDRLHEGIVASFSVMLNLLLNRVGEHPFWRRGRLQRAAAGAHADALIDRFAISPSDAGLRAGALSGGNIQKILLARALDGEAKLVVFNKPSYGLDLHTVRVVRDEIAALANSGVAVVLISTDLDELLELSDRIAVLSDGRIVGELAVAGQGAVDPACSEISQEELRTRIGHLIAGGEPQ